MHATTTPTPRLARGYTLAEMLITIVVLGIGSALVVPVMGNAGVLRIHGAVRTLVADLTFAQTDALAYQQRRAVIFDEAANSYLVAEVVLSTGGDVEYVPLYQTGGPNGEYRVDFDSQGFDNARLALPDFEDGSILHFDELGAPVEDAASDIAAGVGSVYIDGAQSTFRIDVSPYTGQVTVEKVDGLPDA